MTISFALRSGFFDGVKYRFFASCMVIVLPPREKLRVSQSLLSAALSSFTSTPLWLKNAASSLTKTSTTAVQTFLSPVSGLIGTVAYGEIEWYRGPVGKNTATSDFSVDKNTVLPRVDIVMATENMDGALINAAAAAGAKGIVIAGVGNGNMTKTALDALAAQAKKGVVAVRSSRVTTGQVGRNVEVDDDKLGLVASLGLNPQKSRVLLRLALLKTTDPKTIQRYFDEY